MRSALHQLRSLLPPQEAGCPWILSVKGALCWNPQADYWLDVHEFSQAIASTSCEQVTAGVARYGGDLLPELSGEWVLAERARLRDQYLSSLHRLATMQAEHLLYLAALDTAQRLVHEDPLSEVAQRELARLRYLTGDRAGALRQISDFQNTLERNGFASRLSSETLALRDSIVSGLEISPPESARMVSASKSGLQPSTPANIAMTGGRSVVSEWVSRLSGRPFSIALTVVIAAVLLAIMAWYRPFGPHATMTLSGPQAVEDTWIASAAPGSTSGLGFENDQWLYIDLHDGRGPVKPETPFAQYPAARLNLAGSTVIDALLAFDMAQLPAWRHVESAYLTIYLERDYSWMGKPQVPPVTITAYRILREWDSLTATFSFPWLEPGLKPGEDYESRPLSWQTVTADGFVTFDLSDAFPAWQWGHNYGVVLMVTEAPAGESEFWMITSEHPESSHWPRLTIRYR